MTAKVAVLALHGMGETKEDFADELRDGLEKQLRGQWEHVHFEAIYYQFILQPNQMTVFDRMKARDSLDATSLRRFVLFGFSDAAGLERRPNAPGSPYTRAQQVILAALDRAFAAGGAPLPVVIIAQSLGCQVISNYLWDAQRQGGASQGVWRPPGPDGVTPGSARDRFLRLRSLRFLYTTGCNIPIFVAGYPQEEIVAVKSRRDGYAFTWKNLYDPDDPLGWPLRNLSPSYSGAVANDVPVNVGGLLKSWNPLSHTGYWEDRDVVSPLARDVRTLLP